MPDTGIETGLVDTGFADTGFADTGFADTGFADTGFADTGFADTGFSDTGFGDTAFVDTTVDTGLSCDTSFDTFGDSASETDAVDSARRRQRPNGSALWVPGPAFQAVPPPRESGLAVTHP